MSILAARGWYCLLYASEFNWVCKSQFKTSIDVLGPPPQTVYGIALFSISYPPPPVSLKYHCQITLC